MDEEEYICILNSFSSCGCAEIWDKLSEIRDEGPNSD